MPVFFYCWIQLQYFCGKVTVFEYLCHVVDAHRTDETKKWFALNNKGMEKKRKGLVCLRTGFVLFGVKLAFDMSVIQLHCILKWKTESKEISIRLPTLILTVLTHLLLIWITIQFPFQYAIQMEVHFLIQTFNAAEAGAINLFAATAIKQKNWFSWSHCIVTIRVKRLCCF